MGLTLQLMPCSVSRSCVWPLEPSETICRYHRSMGHGDIPKQPKEEEVKRPQCLDVKILGIIEESFLAGIIPLKVAGKYGVPFSTVSYHYTRLRVKYHIPARKRICPELLKLTTVRL